MIYTNYQQYEPHFREGQKVLLKFSGGEEDIGIAGVGDCWGRGLREKLVQMFSVSHNPRRGKDLVS